MNTVVKLRNTSPVPPSPRYSKKLIDADKAMNILRYEMHTWDYKALAKEVGVSTSCILAIRSGRTKWPRPNTFFGLLRALRLEMHLIKKT